MKTYNDIYIYARKTLKAEGVSEPGFEARELVAKAAGKTVDQLIRDFSLYVSDDFQDTVSEYLERRIIGEPMAYILGEWDFYGLTLNVTPDVLIPRTDTEVLAEKAIEMLRGRESATRMLDLCCGTGCIGLAVAAHVPDCRVILVDNSLKALRVARSNVLRTGLSRAVTCIDADALQPPPVLLGTYDLICCNPPYIPTEDILGLDPSVRDYEPVEALDGGSDGLDFYRAIIAHWTDILRPRGCFMFEVGIHQAEAVAALMAKAGYSNIMIFKDTQGIDRVVAGIWLGGTDNG